MIDKDIEIGKIIKDTENTRYFIFSKIQYSETNYLVCVNIKDSQEIVVFKYRIRDNEKLEICKETRESRIQEILLKSLA